MEDGVYKVQVKDQSMAIVDYRCGSRNRGRPDE
jgi:hypothetical protein